MMDHRIRIGIASVVTMIWTASYIVSLINHSYHPPPGLDALMPIVAGFFFAQGIREQGRRSDEREREDIREIMREEREHEQSSH